MEEAKKSAPSWMPSAKANLRLPFYSFCDEWLRINHPRLHTSTYVKYQSVLEKYIKPQLGGFYPDELTSRIISDFSQKLLYEKRLSPKTVKDILLILHSVLEYTQKNYSGRMNAIEIIYPKNEQGKIRVLSIQEQKILTEYLLTNMDLCKFGVVKVVSLNLFDHPFLIADDYAHSRRVFYQFTRLLRLGRLHRPESSR